MAFMALFGWIFIPIFVIALFCMAAQSALLWVMTHTFLINVIAGILLALNLLVLVLLLRARARRKREGVKQFRWLLLLAALWEAWVVFLCALWLVIQPLQYIQLEKLPVDIGRDYKYSQEINYGTWTITDCQGVTPDCTLTQEEMDQLIGQQVTYSANRFTSTEKDYPLEPSYAYQRNVIGKDRFSALHGMELEELEIYNRKNLDYVWLILPEGEEGEEPVGRRFYIWNQDAILILYEGAFFRAERTV